ncbi:hypothetical protein [Paludisphaera borealis]|uniref:Uncharacterized protein n=1 Tax=Paludisphaera borealis TaxID=1387353 RepID=A0A1U7CKJ9_9BACT|nr:hypothetical protein [Paludisphaera borealis]APW59437.1 hypothetical protein BSF38_00860 [Paludisphaera borealis]
MSFTNARTRTLLIPLLAVVLGTFAGCSVQDPDQPAVGSVSGGEKKPIEATKKSGSPVKAAKH